MKSESAKPLIGIVVCGLSDNRQFVSNPYIQSVRYSGGIPILLPLIRSDTMLEQYLRLCDGFLFCVSCHIIVMVLAYVKKEALIRKSETKKEKKMRKWIDMHCDTLSELLSAETLEENSLCVDRKRMEQTKMLAEFFACFVCVPDGKWEEAYQKVIEMIARMERETKENKKLKLIKTAKELEYAEREELNLALLTVEEGGVLNGNRNRLEELYQRGVRLITLTWNYENCIGYPNSRNAQEMQKGLKSFGKQMVEEMNERGMLVDVSHLSDGGFWDCIRLSKKPIIASHSNARALCAHPRNLSDEMLCALGECGGVVGLNFYPQFLQSDRSAEVLDIAKHGMHILQKAGEDSVALGTDFDGFEAGQNWLRGIEEIECVWDALKKAGMTERQLDKLSYQNVKRVLEEVL